VTKNSLLVSLASLFLLFTSAATALAQTDLHDWNNVKNIAAGSDIWIKGQHGRCSGAFAAADDTEIRLQEWRRKFFGGRYSHLCVVPREQVKEVRFAKRALSALAGTAIGTGVGAGIGFGVESQYPNQREDGHLLSAVLAIVGGAVGEGIGEHTAFLHGGKIYVAQ
jgi:hypothetical protein